MRDRPSDGLLKAMAVIGRGETKDNNHPDINPPHWTEVSKVIGVQSPRHLPGHLGRTVQMVLGIHVKRGDDGRKVV